LHCQVPEPAIEAFVNISPAEAEAPEAAPTTGLRSEALV
jgi:hypothetical protein